jgi:hypothetical protein
MHRWTFTTTPVETPDGHSRVEAVWARCRRADCPTFGEARLVHWEGETPEPHPALAHQVFLPGDVF